MDCGAVRDAILEAETHELRGEGESQLAVHLRSCERCRAVAERVLEGQAELARALDALGPRAGVEDALAAVRLRAEEEPRRGRRRAWRWAAAVPLAAAAGLAALLLLSNGDGQRPPAEPVAARPSRAETLPAVESRLAQNVAVFETGDPKIVVVWFF